MLRPAARPPTKSEPGAAGEGTAPPVYSLLRPPYQATIHYPRSFSKGWARAYIT